MFRREMTRCLYHALLDIIDKDISVKLDASKVAEHDVFLARNDGGSVFVDQNIERVAKLHGFRFVEQNQIVIAVPIC